MSYHTPAFHRGGLAVVVLGHLAILGALVILRPTMPASTEAAPLMATLVLPEPMPPMSAPEPPPPRPELPTPAPKMTVLPPPTPEVPVVLAKPEAVLAPSPVVVPTPPAIANPEPQPLREPAVGVPKVPVTLPPSPQAAPAVARAPATPPVEVRPAQASPAQADEMRRYLAQLMGQLNRHKRYPVALKKAKIEGRVVLEFTLDKFGRLTASRVKQGSGHPELDQAALSMLARATPLPAIPAAMNKEELSMAVPVEYSLITDR